MGRKDPRVDAYVSKSRDFAKPILNHLRQLVHDACPPVEETMKWGFPHFMYEGILCSMASFSEHCAFMFWKGSLIVGDGARDAMGQFGRITKVSDLPSRKVMTGYIKEAMKLNNSGVKSPARSKPKGTKELVIPPEFATALKQNKKAASTFESFPTSHKREYADWIAEAKGEDTRKRRLDTAIEWISEGKSRNWKYEKR